MYSKVPFAKYFVLLFFLLPSSAFSQRSPANENNLPPAYMLDPCVLRNQIFAETPDYLKKAPYLTMACVFSNQSAYTIGRELSMGSVYYNWPELETYLNKILKKVTPPELKQDTTLHVYVMKDGNFNARMAPGGKMFINIGVFDDVTDEASLAAIMAHELAHYYTRDALRMYVASETGRFKIGFDQTSRMASAFSVKQELSADSLALRWLHISSYHISGIMNVFEIQSRYEQNALCRSSAIKEQDESDHPLAGERYSQLLQYYNYHRLDSGQLFLISDSLFNQIKQDAKTEILKCLLDNSDYNTCNEKAFKYHLFDPGNSTYIWYIMESLRRNCHWYPNSWNQFYITSRYYDTVRVAEIVTKREMTDPLLKTFNPAIFDLCPKDAEQIKAKFYWDGEIRFQTNEEAFNYFFKLSLKLKNPESFLSNALSFSRDTISRNIMLRKYISCPDIKKKQFASDLLEGQLENKLPSKKLMVFNDFYTTIRLGRDDVPIEPNDSASLKILRQILDSISGKNPNIIPLYMPDLKKDNMIDFIQLLSLQFYTLYNSYNSVDQNDLYMLDPAYWDLFNKYGVNEIEFINCEYYEERPAEKLLDNYWKLMNTNIRELLMEQHSAKYLEIWIIDTRIIREKPSKFTYYDGDNKMEYKDEGFRAVIEEIRAQLIEKSKAQREQDLIFLGRLRKKK